MRPTTGNLRRDATARDGAARDVTTRDGAGRAVIVMAKRPAPGHTKTRLMPALTAEEAAAFYECLLLDTIDRVRSRADAALVVAIDEPSSSAWFTEIAPDAQQIVQIGDTLGDRLGVVLSGCLDQGFHAVFAINSDGPDVPDAHLDAAFAALDSDDTDVVLGPTHDGGYWLIGWKRRWPAMVREVTMSTPDVLADTLAIAERLGARIALAPEWDDIDEPADLDRKRDSIDPALAPRTAAFLASGTS